MKKEELLSQLKAIEEKERSEAIDAAYLEYKKLEGKFYKEQNYFSYPKKKSDDWWIYIKVCKVEKDDVYFATNNVILAKVKCLCFQTDKYGTITIETKKNIYGQSLGKEITKKEFDEAFLAMSKTISGLAV